MYSSRVVPYRTFKNFGHKREPVSRLNFLWHGFLTFSFIGLGLEWKKIARLIFGDDGDTIRNPMDPMDPMSEQK